MACSGHTWPPRSRSFALCYPCHSHLLVMPGFQPKLHSIRPAQKYTTHQFWLGHSSCAAGVIGDYAWLGGQGAESETRGRVVCTGRWQWLSCRSRSQHQSRILLDGNFGQTATLPIHLMCVSSTSASKRINLFSTKILCSKVIRQWYETNTQKRNIRVLCWQTV